MTHSFDEAFLLGSQMAIMNKGEIVQVGEPGEVFRKPNCRFAAEFLGVSNVFRGKSTRESGISKVSVNGFELASTTILEGDVYASVRPEDVLVSLKPLESSARNSLHGKITDISDTGTIVRVTMENGEVPFIAAITRRSCLDMDLKAGSEVYFSFKATDVHLF